MAIRTITEALSPQDFIFPAPTGGGQTRADEYDFTVTIGNIPTQIDLITSTPGYDPFLEVIDTRTNTVIFSNDDGGGIPNARLNLNNLQVGVPYKLRVTSFGTINTTIDNNYSLTVNTAQGDFQLNARLSSFVNQQSGTTVTKTGTLNSNDYTFPDPINGTPSLADEYSFQISTPNQPISIALNSLTPTYDPFVQVINSRTGDVIRFDDDGGPGTDSLIEGFTAQPGIDYRIRVTSFNPLVPSTPSQYSLQVNGQGVNVSLAERGIANPVTLSINDVTVTEQSGTAILTVALSSASTQTITVDYATANDTATSGNDYQQKNGTLTFNPNQTSQQIAINLVDDTIQELTEIFKVNLSNPTNATISDSEGRVTITDNDSTTPPPTDPLLNSQIYRFQNRNVPGTYLFAGQQERQGILANFPNFVEEGPAFKVSAQPGTDLITMYRFQNSAVPGTYLYAGAEERLGILRNFPNFREEGIAFYVYDSNASKGVDFFRFQNSNIPGTYLFAGQAEANNIISSFPNFNYEGTAFEVGA